VDILTGAAAACVPGGFGDDREMIGGACAIPSRICLRPALLACAAAVVAGVIDCPREAPAQLPPASRPAAVTKEIAPVTTRLSRKVDRVIDGHVHFRRFSRLEPFLQLRQQVGVDRMNVVCILNPATAEGNAMALVAKAAGAGTIYCFGGLDHTTYKSGGKVKVPSLADQVDLLMEAGFDGVKLIEGKPSVRHDWYPFDMDGDSYRDFWARAEQRDVPIVWHVADPAAFWGAKGSSQPDWNYGGEHPTKDRLHQEVDNVLTRHRRLRVMLAHFSFLAGDLPRLTKLMTDHPNARLDMALGWDLLYELSDDVGKSRAFFLAFQDRIVYGTDTSDRNHPSLARQKAQAIRRFLETDETFTLRGQKGSGGRTKIRGLSLPKEVLAKIYASNFEALAGADPKPLDMVKAKAYCRRAAEVTAALTGTAPADTTPGQALAALEKIRP